MIKFTSGFMAVDVCDKDTCLKIQHFCFANSCGHIVFPVPHLSVHLVGCRPDKVRGGKEEEEHLFIVSHLNLE